MKLTTICLAFVVTVFFCHIGNAEDTLPKKMPGPDIELGVEKNEDILLSLFFVRDFWFTRTLEANAKSGEENARNVPYLIIWNDGSFLSRKIDDKTEKPVEFYTGRIEKNEITKIVSKVQMGFRAKPNASVSDIGPEASYYKLQIRTGDNVFVINTWEQFGNAKSFKDYEVFSADQTKDNTPIFLPEFYEKWKQCKKYLFEISNKLSSSDDAVPVHPVVSGGLIHPIVTQSKNEIENTK